MLKNINSELYKNKFKRTIEKLDHSDNLKHRTSKPYVDSICYSDVFWLEACDTLDEVKQKYPEPDNNMVVYLKNPSTESEKLYVAIINDKGKWVQVLIQRT